MTGPAQAKDVHPFLLAIFPVISLYSANVQETWPQETVVPAIVVLVATAALYTLSRLLLRHGHKAALLVSLLLLVVFSYVPLSTALDGYGIPKAVTLGALLVAAAGLSWMIFRTRGTLEQPTKIANVTALFLVISAALPLLGPHFEDFDSVMIVDDLENLSRRRSGIDVSRRPPPATSAPESRALDQELTASRRPESPPDIYYIVFDQYASADVLEKYFHYDNGEFLNGLKSKGFYVAAKSQANYPRTSFALSSNLNLLYSHRLAQHSATGPRDWKPVNELIGHHKVGTFLKRHGYRYVHMGTWWEPTARSPIADLNINASSVVRFSTLLFHNSIFGPLLERSNPDYDMRRSHWEGERQKFAMLPTIGARSRQPVFVFAHFLLTHEPYVFSSDGSYLSNSAEAALGRDAAYVEQIRFANKAMTGVIDQLLAESRRSGSAPVIILQSDEGPYPLRLRNHDRSFRWPTASSEELELKSGVLNAMLLPQLNAEQALYPSISPVNTFRVVFNGYFGTRLPLLRDETLFFDSLKEIYRMHAQKEGRLVPAE